MAALNLSGGTYAWPQRAERETTFQSRSCLSIPAAVLETYQYWYHLYRVVSYVEQELCVRICISHQAACSFLIEQLALAYKEEEDDDDNSRKRFDRSNVTRLQRSQLAIDPVTRLNRFLHLAVSEHLACYYSSLVTSTKVAISLWFNFKHLIAKLNIYLFFASVVAEKLHFNLSAYLATDIVVRYDTSRCHLSELQLEAGFVHTETSTQQTTGNWHTPCQPKQGTTPPITRYTIPVLKNATFLSF